MEPEIGKIKQWNCSSRSPIFPYTRCKLRFYRGKVMGCSDHDKDGWRSSWTPSLASEAGVCERDRGAVDASTKETKKESVK
jgi:hypothetical protein